ncbi:MAG TPA: prepilin-type N-terminal cleavage/methylation domain-containing protein [Planctomycetota bacterium]|nr:prepilin-type N-terminal cleavage/methylation domain-containing protein [Planctomycetota bacterium]
MKTRVSSQGFTLVEVLIAMAIIGITAVVLLEQRIGIVKDAARARDKRTCWVLASQKMAELELDKTLWIGTGSSNNGDFSEVDPEYGAFAWEYQIVREEIQASDPEQVKEGEAKKRELYRLTLIERPPGIDDPVLLEAEFSTVPPKTDTPDPTKDPAKDPTKDPQAPPAASTTGGPPK